MGASTGVRARHAARKPHGPLVALAIGIIVTAIGCLWSLGDAMAAGGTSVAAEPLPPSPAVATGLPAVTLNSTIAEDPCGNADVVAGLDSGDDAAVVAAFGGGVAFRDAVIAGTAPCIALDDPTHIWVVVNKSRPLNPVDYEPGGLRTTWLQSTSGSVALREAAAADLEAMAQAISDQGAGVIGINNGYRGYGLQKRNYNINVAQGGVDYAEQLSARPGFSEHQTGLALDVISCSNRCSSFEAFDTYPESDWIVEHAWEFGYIVRYEADATGITGYVPEPWHLRYIGRDLAAAYHEGGYHTLEEFFGLPAAPDYTG